ncbi:hypothetical protein Sjap_008426 [Stephania japonica]|uniref:AAA ATPase AAA+ lid domain-containing protein n=1 Tax=Stephania japonica TaxID=461633 RepID=A0AAP0JPL5_9MAGN
MEHSYSAIHLANARVMILAATNQPLELDEAILRRIPQAFEIGMPDCSERVKILKTILKCEKVEEGFDYEHVARLCEEYTGSDLFELCKQATYLAVSDILRDEKEGKPTRRAPRPMSQSDLQYVLATSMTMKVAATEYSRLS